MNRELVPATIWYVDQERVPPMSPKPVPPAYEKGVYVAQLEAARGRIKTTKTQLLDWLQKLDEHAASVLVHLEPMMRGFPTLKEDVKYRLVYDIHSGEKRYGCLGIALRCDAMRTDLCKLNQQDLMKLLQPFFGSVDAKQHAVAFQKLNRLNDRIAGLKFLGAEFPQSLGRGAVLPRWFEGLSTYGLRCLPLIEDAFAEFEMLSDALDEAMFEFNSTMGAVRYRSIRCTYTLDDYDLLGPSNPALKVVTSINRATKHRRYNVMTDFKKSLKRKRIAQELKRQLGRDPEPSDVSNALNALRPRKESEWITKEVIKACYFGRSIKEIFSAQENLVAVMQPWNQIRTQLQALLP
ncbi:MULTISPECIES: hypothetical protein [Pseudomonas]|uniref:hypothetical protein n=1 Tax=Pseudomonas TaxID=286 RepID=UPI000AD7919C|nr:MULTISPECIES: hypothetical protein [Pseudomonas]WHS57406.1 hypothetical protein QLH64_30785 [Pseudomonas brassicacearum]